MSKLICGYNYNNFSFFPVCHLHLIGSPFVNKDISTFGSRPPCLCRWCTPPTLITHPEKSEMNFYCTPFWSFRSNPCQLSALYFVFYHELLLRFYYFTLLFCPPPKKKQPIPILTFLRQQPFIALSWFITSTEKNLPHRPCGGACASFVRHAKVRWVSVPGLRAAPSF